MQNKSYFQNPLWKDSVPDPAVILGEDGFLYCYGTPDLWDDGSCHQVPILRSDDGVHYEYVASVFEKCPNWEGGQCLWACEIARIQGRYILYYTLMDGEGKPRIGYARAAAPGGPFTDGGCLIRVEDAMGIWMIDPTPVRDEDGQWYLICGNYEQGTCIFPLTEDGMGLAGSARRFSPGYEGVSIISRRGFYYLLGSLGTCTDGEATSYHVVCARSRSLLGPYVDKHGYVITEENKDQEELLVVGRGSRFIGPGNNTWIRDSAGDDWLILHAVDMENLWLEDGGTRRVLCMEKLLWDEEGWPYTEEKRVSDIRREGPVWPVQRYF